jgi:carboxypeptidase family protein
MVAQQDFWRKTMRRKKTIVKRSKRSRLLVGAALVMGAATFLSWLSAWRAQGVNATIVGTVKDASGAVMPNVNVTVRNDATNIAHTSTSNGLGDYFVGALIPGGYTISAESQGFKTAVITGITLQVNQTARIDITMQPGAVAQRVQVTGLAPVINTENPEIGAVIEQNRILDLPLNGRNFMELTTLTAGINEGNGSTQKYYASGFAPAAAGQPATENNYTLDGADNKSRYFNIYSVAPSVDAVQEFKIQIGQYSAEFGTGGGAVINVATKSGSNELHGSAFEFLRNQIFDARNFFARNQAGPTGQDIPDTARSPLRRNQFGGSVGGPVIKNKVFFFGNYDGTRYRAPGTAVATVPTDAEKGGDLSAFGKTLTNPFTGLPFTGGIIPASQTSPISTKVLAYYPEPTSSALVGNYVRSFSNQINQDSFLARVDYSLSEKNALMIRYGYQNFSQIYPGTFPLVGGSQNPERFQNGAMTLTSSITPHFLNEFRFGYNRWNNFSEGQNRGKPIDQELGIKLYTSEPFDQGFPGGISFGNSTISGVGESDPFLVLTNTFQFYDGVTWIHGAHTVKAGASMMRNRGITDCVVHGNGVYSFSGQYTGDGFADFLLGYPNSYLVSTSPSARIHVFQTQMAYYVLDDWKVTPKLTLNAGLRYEWEQYPWDTTGASAIFDPTLRGPTGVVGGLRYPKQNKTAEPFYTQVRPDLPFGFLNRKSALLSDKNNFAPRFGFAYRPFDNTRTVIRGGYGWFYASPQNNNIEGNLDFTVPTYVTPSWFGNPTVPNLTWNGIPGVAPADLVKSLTFSGLTGPETQFVNGYTQQYSLGVAREVAHNTSIEVQYVGSKSTHLEEYYDYNWTQPSPLPLVPRLPYPSWGRLDGFSSGGNATYNALLVSAERRFAEGLSFHAAYTYGKALGSRGARSYYGNQSQVQDPGNLKAEYGPTGDDVTHRFVLSYVYELPFGPGKLFGGSVGGVAGKVVGGWRLAGITTLRTGFALLGPLVSGANCNSSNCNYCRPDLIGNPMLPSTGVDTPRFNARAFDWPLNPAHPLENPRFGNSQPNLLRGNYQNAWDMALLKDTKFRERYNLEFRFEMFNFPNHANFSDPCIAVDSGTFGRTFGASDGRDIQFALKLYW